MAGSSSQVRSLVWGAMVERGQSCQSLVDGITALELQSQPSTPKSKRVHVTWESRCFQFMKSFCQECLGLPCQVER